MTVNVPAENAEKVGLRWVIDQEMVEVVVKALSGGSTEMPKNWNRRFKHNRDKMKTGDILELAEVVRNLALRDHEKGLSTGEKQMYVKAKKILASELMYAKDMTEDEAHAWLEEVLANPAKGKRQGQAEDGRHRDRLGAFGEIDARSPGSAPWRRGPAPTHRRAAFDLAECRAAVPGTREREPVTDLGEPAWPSWPRGAARGSAATGPRRSSRSAERPLLAESLERLDLSRLDRRDRRRGPGRLGGAAILLAEELVASKVAAVVTGGATRAESVRDALAEVAATTRSSCSSTTRRGRSSTTP